ncbi:MAG: Gfo/Idh/MocA family protein [Desulfopila sp.]
MEKVRWGILSTAAIGQKKVIPAIQAGMYCEVTAIASREYGKARAAADRLGLGKAYGSYEELLADPDIDAIYNPLPNHLHVDWSIKALWAGKHVLCEKPIGLNAIDGERLLLAAASRPDLKVMEAFMYRLHPQWQRARRLVAEGAIGTLLAVESFFSYCNVDANNIRNQADVGGGALMDIGCYCLSLSRLLFEAEPKRVIGVMFHDEKFGTDYLTSAILDFGHGSSIFTCSTQLEPYQRVNVVGTTGRIEIEMPFNPEPLQSTRMYHYRDGKRVEIVFEACNQYTLQADAFSLAVLEDIGVPTPLDESLRNMRVLDSLVKSATRGTWLVV